MNTSTHLSKKTPSWYPLAIYQAKLSSCDWANELTKRKMIQELVNVDQLQEAKKLFANYLTNGQDVDVIDRNENLETVFPVKALSAFDAMYIATEMEFSKKGKQLKTELQHIRVACDPRFYFKPDIQKAQLATAEDYMDKAKGEIINRREVLKGMPISIDITLDDDTLIESFKLWLQAVRSVSEPLESILHKDLQQWQENQILAAIDLGIWAKIENINLTPSELATLLWPTGKNNPKQHYKTTTQPLVQKVFNWEIITRLTKQAKLLKGLGDLDTEHDINQRA